MDARPVITVQQGARRNYAYSRLLEGDALLNYAASDLAWSHESDNAVLRWARNRFGTVRRRTIQEIPARRVCASALPNLIAPLRRVMDEERFFDLKDEVLALRLRMRGLRGAKVVVSYFGNGGSFLSHAKRRGALVVTDFIISPNARDIELREQEAWPGWEHSEVSRVSSEVYRRRFLWLLKISDIYLCPSQSTADDLSALPFFDPSRLRIVPYGAGGIVRGTPAPEPGRVLFAGGSPLRKGIPYLAQAATILKATCPSVRIVCAGEIAQGVRERAETRDLEFLGHLDQAGMARELARADVFCLPSLSEGSASSIYEALAYRLPVVTTRASGSVVRDGVEGFIVPSADGEATARAIQAIVTDRSRRDAMATNAAEAAERYSEDRCGDAFLAVIRECLDEAGPLRPGRSPIPQTSP